MKHITVNLGITSSGACNLACPSCAVGQPGGKSGKREFMTLQTLEAIIEKSKREFIPDAFALFDWNEPLLHPKIHEFILSINQSGIPCWISSNLSFDDPRCVLDSISAQPAEFRVSCSGFTQEVYCIGHRGGRIDYVKSNLKLLAAYANKTKVYVLWHRYKHNVHEEKLMREYCGQLGIGFGAVEAVMMPVEKVVQAFNGIVKKNPIMESLITPLQDAAKFCSEHTMDDCRILTDQLCLDWNADVALCCATFKKMTALNFLTHSFEDIQYARMHDSYCNSCTEVGAHFYANQEWTLAKRLYAQAARVIKRYVTV